VTGALVGVNGLAHRPRHGEGACGVPVQGHVGPSCSDAERAVE
jgi:hypothetical protein